MTVIYRKTTSLEVLSAWKAYEADAEALSVAGRAFGDHFGGTPLYRSGLEGVTFVGLRFHPAKGSPLWTKPDNRNGLQRPRASLNASSVEEKVAAVALRDDWNARRPTAKASLEPFLASIGTSLGGLFFTGSFKAFAWLGAMWVSCGVDLSEEFIEVFASEFEAALKAHDASKKQVATNMGSEAGVAISS